ncbi:MAG: 2-dehydropantoate 2-reductase [Conexivisphaerales archaeon]
MRFAIIGAGSVGGYLGARLQMAGNEVTFVVREKRREQLEKSGLKLITPAETVSLRVDARVSASDIKRCDVCIVTVRNYSLDEVIDQIKSLASGGASIISLLNGVEHIEKISNAVARHKIVGGSAYIDSRLGDNGEIIHRSQVPRIVLGRLTGLADSNVEKIRDVFVGAGINTDVVEDLEKFLWKKYMFVLAGSFTAVAGCHIGEILEQDYGADTLRLLLREFQEVGLKSGVSLSEADIEDAFQEVKRQNRQWTSLLYEDLHARRKTEVEALWGYLVRKAREVGYDARASHVCYSILKIREAMNASP